MKYVYYQSVPDGKITNFHQLTLDCTNHEIKQRLAEYNKEHCQTCNAVVIDVEEGSFMDFLIHKANERVQINKETLENLADALSEASAIVDSLRFGG